MSMKEVKNTLKLAMGGFFLFGAFMLVLAKGFRLWGLGFIVISILIALFLQFVLGEDVIRIRKPKQMK